MQSNESFEQQVLERLGHLEHRFDKLDTDVNNLKTDVNSLKIATLEANTRIDAYQKASLQVTNLAFALITAATVTIIVSAVLGK